MAVQADYFAEARGGTKYVIPREGNDNRARSESRSSGYDRKAKGQGDAYRRYDTNRQRNSDRGKSLIGGGTSVEIGIEIVAGGESRVTIVEIKETSLPIVHSGDAYTEPLH